MRKAIGLFSTITVVLAASANAFDGYEHRAVSNAALLVAARYAGAAADPEFVATARSLVTKELNDSRTTFGDLTVAVDWFQDITQLTRAHPFKVIGKRQRFYMAWRKGISLHRNTLHFQRQALCAYLMLHRNALVLARTRATWEESLYTEAVALHFLQDFFSAGHFVTPRKHSHDAVAGSLHDRFGRIGLPLHLRFSPGGKLIEPWRSLAAAAEQELASFGKGVTFDEATLSALDGVETLQIGGDTCLNEIPGQRLFVLLISAESIAEVLHASALSPAGEKQLAVCFNERWAQRERPETFQFLEEPSRKGPSGGPEAELTLAESSRPKLQKLTIDLLKSETCEQQVPPCNATATWLARYDTPVAAYTDLGDLDASGLQVTAAGLPAVRRSIGVEALLWGSDPRNTVVVHDEENKALDRHFVSGFRELYATGGLLFVESNRYRAVGFRFGFAYDVPRTALGATVMVEPSLYKFSGGHARRLDIGIKVTYGIQVVNLALLMERGHQIDDRGRFHQRYFVTPGVELTLSNSWLRKVFGVSPGPCCKSR